MIKSSYIDLITPVIDNQIKNQTNEQFSSNQFNSNNIIVYVSSFKYITKCSQVIALQYISNKENEHRKYNLINVKDCKTLYDYQKLIKAIETLYTQSIDAIANKKYKLSFYLKGDCKAFLGKEKELDKDMEFNYQNIIEIKNEIKLSGILNDIYETNKI